MFRGWGFLLTEIWVLIALAALIGLFIGWLIWGRRAAGAGADGGEAERLRAELQACQTRARDCAQRVSRLEGDLAKAMAAQAAPVSKARAAAPEPAPSPEPASEPAAEPVSEPVAEAVAQTDTEAQADAPGAAADPTEVGTRPDRLEAARDGVPDDLKRIKGIGPKLEKLCNRLGFFHFDQIANWTDDEIAWVDANLESFKGRVTRDNWVAQARDLMGQG